MTSKKFQKETRPLSLLMRISARERKAIEMAAIEKEQSISEFMRSASKLKQLIAKYELQELSTNKTK